MEKNKEFEENRKKLSEETSKYLYNQSSSGSSVSRKLIFGVIGTIWVITYKEGQLSIPNRFMFASLLIALIYLVADVFHYFFDSIRYEKELYRLDKYETQEDLDKKHEAEMDDINKWSRFYFIYKFVTLFFSSLYLVLGLFGM